MTIRQDYDINQVLDDNLVDINELHQDGKHMEIGMYNGSNWIGTLKIQLKHGHGISLKTRRGKSLVREL